jgi:outer membrane receptor for ferrienterochelin and colicins
METADIDIYGFPLGQADGLAPVSTPRHAGSIRLDWQARENVSAYFRANYRGKDNQGVNWGGGSNPMNESAGDLLTFDIGASWQVSDNFTINGAVYNITNKTNYDPDRTGSYQYIEDGRRFWLGARATF